MARNRRQSMTAAVLCNRKARRYYRSAQTAHAATSNYQFYLAVAAGVVFYYFYFSRIQV